MDVKMPHGREAFINKMEEYVPGSKKATTDLIDLCAEIVEANEYIESCGGTPDSNVLREKFPNYLRTGAYSVNTVFKKALKLPQRAIDILATYWGYLGVDLDHLNFTHYACMLYVYIMLGAYIPKNTSHEISAAMVARFRELGGDVWYNTRAEEFLFDGDKLCGVRTNRGDIECIYALPNICPDIVYGKMIPKELIPEREKKLSTARADKFAGRFITGYFCLDKSAEELGIKDYTIFMGNTNDTVKCYNGIYEGEGLSDHVTFVCVNTINPDFSPKGTCVVSFTAMGSPKYWNAVSQKDYFDIKNQWAENWLNILKEKTGIDLFGHIEEMSVATPWTFARYLGNPEGNVYGFENRD